MEKQKKSRIRKDIYIYISLDLRSSCASRGAQGINEKPPVIPHVRRSKGIFPRRLKGSIYVSQVRLIDAPECIAWPASSSSFGLSLERRFCDPGFIQTKNMPQIFLLTCPSVMTSVTVVCPVIRLTFSLEIFATNGCLIFSGDMHSRKLEFAFLVCYSDARFQKHITGRG